MFFFFLIPYNICSTYTIEKLTVAVTDWWISSWLLSIHTGQTGKANGNNNPWRCIRKEAKTKNQRARPHPPMAVWESNVRLQPSPGHKGVTLCPSCNWRSPPVHSGTLRLFSSYSTAKINTITPQLNSHIRTAAENSAGNIYLGHGGKAAEVLMLKRPDV